MVLSCVDLSAAEHLARTSSLVGEVGVPGQFAVSTNYVERADATGTVVL